ncbi:MAG: methyltransferase domain-containing protein [Pseudomonadales bacterium]|nr:methyltransferase domain-containing protein [Pseudomonadales bacterium]
MRLSSLAKSTARYVVRKHRFSKRYDVINYFARRNNANSYLEIGINKGRCLERVNIEIKVGVDPNPRLDSEGFDIRAATSDDFFGKNNSTFDVVFIDGLHLAEQVLKDIRNSLACLNSGGVILLHDCNPQSQQAASRQIPFNENRHWNGDTWKAIAFIHEKFPNLFSRVLDLDQGIGVIFPGEKPDFNLGQLDFAIQNTSSSWFDSHDWFDLDRNRSKLIGLIDNRKELEAEIASVGL